MRSNLPDLPDIEIWLYPQQMYPLTSSGQEWQFQVSIVTVDIPLYQLADLPPVLTSCGKI